MTTKKVNPFEDSPLTIGLDRNYLTVSVSGGLTLLRKAHAYEVLMHTLYKNGCVKNMSVVKFNPQEISFKWKDFKSIFESTLTHSSCLSNNELSQLFYSLFELVTIKDVVLNQTSLVNPTIDRLHLSRIEGFDENGILDTSKIEVIVLGPKITHEKKISPFQTQHIDFRHILLSKLGDNFINEKGLAGFHSMIFRIANEGSPKKKSVELVWNLSEISRIFDVPDWKIKRPLEMRSFLGFVSSGLKNLLKDMCEISITKDGIIVNVNLEKFKKEDFFSNNFLIEENKNVSPSDIPLSEFTITMSYPEKEKEQLLETVIKVSNLSLSNDEENLDSLKQVKAFKRSLVTFVNDYFLDAWKNSSPSYKSNNLWESIIKNNKDKDLQNVVLFTYQSRFRETKGRLYQGKTPAVYGNTSFVGIPSKYKPVFWNNFGKSWNREGGRRTITNFDLSACHANIPNAFMSDYQPIIWDNLLNICKEEYLVDISRADFKQIILSSYNGKVWDINKLKELGLNKSSITNMLLYLDKDPFPHLAKDFFEIAKASSYFFGERISVYKKSKASFILSNIELVLIAAILLDLANNGNELLSYEYDGLVFSGDLAEEKRIVYHQVCENLLGFRIPISAEEFYSPTDSPGNST